VGLHIDPQTPVADLSPAERTLVAIARALNEFNEESVLILDEPTASLPQQEVDRLFTALRGLADSGTALIYISHRLPELLALTDRVTVIRDGSVIATLQTSETSHDAMAELMLGEVETRRPAEADEPPAGAGAELLRLDAVATERLAATDLTLHAGEVLALTGPVGCGASEIGRLLYGMTPPTAGDIAVDGEPFAPRSDPIDAKRRGIAYLPADRQGLSSFQDLTVLENILATDWPSLSSAGRVSPRRARREAQRLVVEMRVEPPDCNRVFRTLSGGNQQKALIAKWLRLRPRILVIDEPTQGIDIRTRGEIYERIRAEAARGLAVLWITSDFEEASVVADRVMVFVGGRHQRTLSDEQISPEEIGRTSLLENA
jgi:ribose transport system ATP-binding protein